MCNRNVNQHHTWTFMCIQNRFNDCKSR